MPATEKLRKRLEDRKAALFASAKEIDAELRVTPDPDFAEQAVEMEDDEVLEGLGQAAMAEIDQISAALKRIETGTYGACTACGNPIGEARLEAVPHATQCMDCLEE
ncbi:MAG: TraR/DksA family transcriptional regulator [Rhodospirillales bacterium]|nr:TraR/DksA family transcriptional regulator [Rhodospirillales bacterium]